MRLNRMTSAATFAAVTAIGLAGCNAPTSSGPAYRSTPVPAPAASATGASGRQGYFKVKNWSAAELSAALSGTTKVAFTQGFGTQVTYYGRDGTDWLWFPGNNTVIREQWRAEDRPTNQAAICFQAPETTYNAVTHERGGAWKCSHPFNMIGLGGRIAQRQGDVFDLAHRSAPPFVSQATLAEFNHISAQLPAATDKDVPSPLERLMLEQGSNPSAFRRP